MIHFKGHICINCRVSVQQVQRAGVFFSCLFDPADCDFFSFHLLFQTFVFLFFFSYLYFFHLFSFAISVKVAIRTRSCGPWPARYLQRWLTPKVVGCSQDEYIEHVTAHSSKRCSFSLRMFFFLSYLIFLCQGYDCQHRETSDDE